jgi:pimeloyl-ACP methyl ester carboxylesterase
VVAPDLPLHDPSTTYEERARPALAAPPDSVVVAHSLGAAYAPLIPCSLVIYLCPAPTGLFEAVPGGARTGFPFPPADTNGVSVWDPDAAVDAMYPRLPREMAEPLAARLRPGASARGPYPLTEHPDVPSALVYATDDEFFEPEWERRIARDVLGVEPVEIPGGHFPMLEDPWELARLLDGLLSSGRGSSSIV